MCCISWHNYIDPERIDKLTLGSGDITLECVNKFYYLGYVTSTRGGAEASYIFRIRGARKKFQELVSLLASRAFHLSEGKDLCILCKECDVIKSQSEAEVYPNG